MSPRGRLPRMVLLTGVGVIVALAAGAAVWLFLRGDAPERVSLERAVAGVTTVPTAGTDAPSADATGITGAWVVDADSGEFDYESATGTFVGFRVREELVSVGAAEAVGRTGAVDGSVTVDGTTLTAASFTADLTTLTTNESRRDRRVQDALGTATHPTAGFVLAAPAELGDEVAEGGAVTVTATGDFTLNGITQRVTVPIEAQLVGDTAVVVASFEITFADYGVAAPSAPVVLSVEDHGTVEMQLLLVRG